MPRPVSVSTTVWVLLAVVIVAFAFLFSESTPWRRLGDQANTWVLLRLADVRTPWLTDIANGINAAGTGWGITVLGVSVVVLIIIFRRWRHLAVFLGSLAFLEIVGGQLIYQGLTRPRPYGVLAVAAGLTVGAGVLVAFGVPDQRMGADEIAEALRSAGLPVETVRASDVEAKGSRPFVAVGPDGRRWFIKALGSDQRDADLLYRAYRAVRLRNVGDTRPAATLFQAVEHQALVGVMAERAGVLVPGVDRVVKAGSDTALLVLDWVDGVSLELLPAEQITDDLLARLWTEVDKLHRAGIAHRSLHAGNVMADPAGRPVIADFSFSELSATPRQIDLDVAELLASLAALIVKTGPCRPRSRSWAPREWPRRCRCCSRWRCRPAPGAPSRGRTAC